MNERCHSKDAELRQKIIGLGEQSIQKSYYPQLRQKLEEVELARKRLAESEARYRSLVENINDVIISLDASWVVTYISPAIQRLCTLAPEQITGRQFTELVHFDDRPDLASSFERALEGGLEQQEFRLLDEGGTFRYVCISSQPLAEEKHAAGLTCVMSDVTERRKAAEALSQSEAKYRRIVDTAAEGVWLVDANEITTFVNARMAEILGRSAEEMIGQPMTDFMFKEDEPDHQLRMKNRRQGISEQYERRFRRSDGQTVWTIVCATPILDEDRCFQGSFAMFTDITERKQTEQKLFLMSFALNNVRESAFLINENGRFLFVNEQACRTLGYTRGELLRLGLMDINPDFPPDRWTNHWSELRSQRSLNFETRQRTKEGRTFPVEISASYFEHDSVAYNLALVRDITARKRREEHVQQLMREVNHRSKNLLSVIQAIVRMTEAAGTASDFVQRFEERIEALAASQDLLVRNDWKGAEIEALVRSQLGHFADQIASRISLSGPPLTLLSSTAQTLGMAVHELATNASKYGGLSNETGCVQIMWGLANNASGPCFTMAWEESGGPAVQPPTRRGFGSTVVRDMVKMGLDAEIELNYAPTGLVWSITAPLDKVVGQRGDHPSGR